MQGTDKKKELLKKLQALAERGVNGEKETAQKKLELLMEKYNIAEAELSEDKLEDHEFRYHNDFEKKILMQIFYKIVPDFNKYLYKYSRGKGSKSTYGIECTKAQALQIQIEYEFYCELWKEEVAFFLEAFVQKHRIFAPKERAINKDGETMPEEDLLRMKSMMDGMQNRAIVPMIETGGL